MVLLLSHTLKLAIATPNLARSASSSWRPMGLCPFRGPLPRLSSSVGAICSCRWNCPPKPPLVVKMTGINVIPRACSELQSLYLSFLIFSASLVPEFTLRNERLHALELVWLVELGSTSFTSKATLS